MKTAKFNPKLFIIFFFALIILFLFNSCKKKNSDSNIIDDSSLISIMENTQNTIGSPGWMLEIQDHNKYYKYAGGLANREEKIPMEDNFQIRIGSISKTFTATVVLILCDEGVLKLNDKLEDYYPEFPKSDKITIRQLLMHTSGIVTWDENDSIRTQVYENTYDWTIDKLIDWASKQELLFEPDSGFNYSNIGYFLLGKIIETASGSSVIDLINEKICDPLNLENTFMAASPQFAGEMIHGYDESGGTIEDITGTPAADAINFELSWTAGGIISSLDDLSVWSRALYKGKLISDSLLEQQMPVLNPPTENNPYYSGYGMGIKQSDKWIGHNGAISGYVCYMFYYPEGDVSVVTFFNKFSAFDAEVNLSDITAVGQNFMEVAKYVCPETLIPVP